MTICNRVKCSRIHSNSHIMAEYPKEDVVEKDYGGYFVKLCRRYSSSEVLILERE